MLNNLFFSTRFPNESLEANVVLAQPILSENALPSIPKKKGLIGKQSFNKDLPRIRRLDPINKPDHLKGNTNNRIQPEFKRFEQLNSINDSISHQYQLNVLNHRNSHYLPPIIPLGIDQSFNKHTKNRPVVLRNEKREFKTSGEMSLERVSTAALKRRLAELKNKRNF